MNDRNAETALRALADRGSPRDPGQLYDEALARSTTLDVDLSSSDGAQRSPVRSRSRYIAAAAAVLVVAGIGGAAWLNRSDDDSVEQLNTDGSVFCQVMAGPIAEGEADALVYLDPDASAADVEQVEEALMDLPGFADLHYVDDEETWAAFQDIFEGDEAMLESVRPEQLPTSFQLTFREFDGAAKAALRDEIQRLGDLVYDFSARSEELDRRLVDHVGLIGYLADHSTTYAWNQGFRSVVADRFEEILAGGEPVDAGLRYDLAEVQRLVTTDFERISPPERTAAAEAAARLVERAETGCGLVVDDDFGLGLGGESVMAIEPMPTTTSGTAGTWPTTTSGTAGD